MKHAGLGARQTAHRPAAGWCCACPRSPGVPGPPVRSLAAHRAWCSSPQVRLRRYAQPRASMASCRVTVPRITAASDAVTPPARHACHSGVRWLTLITFMFGAPKEKGHPPRRMDAPVWGWLWLGCLGFEPCVLFGLGQLVQGIVQVSASEPLAEILAGRGPGTTPCGTIDQARNLLDHLWCDRRRSLLHWLGRNDLRLNGSRVAVQQSAPRAQWSCLPSPQRCSSPLQERPLAGLLPWRTSAAALVGA